MYLCYNTPAQTDYTGWLKKSVPLGNGSLGVRVFGGIQCEVIQFNEKTLFSGDENRIGSFQNFGEMLINFNTPVPCSENTYLRDLDLETGSAMVACRKGIDGHTRHYFVSAPDNVFVGKIESTGDTLLDFTLSLQSEQNGTTFYDDSGAFITGTVNANNGANNESGSDKNSLEYICCVKVVADDADISFDENGITVKNTFSAVIVMSCATSYYSKDDIEKCRLNAEIASKSAFSALFRRHLDDYKKFMSGASLNIGQSDENITTETQLKIFSKGKSRKNLIALMYEMGKFVLYSCTRRLSLPLTECGIWNSRNVQENGEILINNKKNNSAYETAKLLNMSALTQSHTEFIGIHGEEKRYNPFGAYKEITESKKEEKSAFKALFKRDRTPPDAKDLIEKSLAFLSEGKKEEALKLLSDSVLCAYDNLLMPDIFDNIAFTKAVYKLLLQARDDGVTVLLPALPADWDIGSISGATCGGFEFSFEWKNGRFSKGSVTARKNGECKLFANGKFIGVSDENGNDIRENFENGIVSFSAENGKNYLLY